MLGSYILNARRAPYSGSPPRVLCYGSILAALENDTIFHRPEFHSSALKRANFLTAEFLANSLLAALVGAVDLLQDAHGTRDIFDPPCLDFVQARNGLELQLIIHKGRLFLVQPHGSLRGALLTNGAELLLQPQHALSRFNHSDSPNIKFFHS